MHDRNWAFRILEVEPDASRDAIKSAFRTLVKVWHPDRFGSDEDLRQLAEDKLKLINKAFAIVGNELPRPSRSTRPQSTRSPDESQRKSDSRSGAPRPTRGNRDTSAGVVLFSQLTLALANHIDDIFVRRFGHKLSSDRLAWIRLVGHVETALVQLMYFDQGRVQAPFISANERSIPIHLDEPITRGDFAKATGTQLDDVRDLLVVPAYLKDLQEQCAGESRRSADAPEANTPPQSRSTSSRQEWPESELRRIFRVSRSNVGPPLEATSRGTGETPWDIEAALTRVELAILDATLGSPMDENLHKLRKRLMKRHRDGLGCPSRAELELFIADASSGLNT